jgi:E3 ubiquitin-protein ligase UBR1
MCARWFHANVYDDHNVSILVAQPSGGSYDCGDPKARRVPIACPFHPPARVAELAARALQSAMLDYPLRAALPPDVDGVLRQTIGIALDFVLDTLDHSSDVPAHEADVRAQPTALGAQSYGEVWAPMPWNDDEPSFKRLVGDTTRSPMLLTLPPASGVGEGTTWYSQAGRGVSGIHPCRWIHDHRDLCY